MSDYTFIRTNEYHMLQDALKAHRRQLIRSGLTGLGLLLAAGLVPQAYLYSVEVLDDIDELLLSFKNPWYWLWLLGLVAVLIFLYLKATDIRYWAIKKDLAALQKGTLQAPMEALYLEKNNTQTHIMLLLEDNKRRLFYWMQGALQDFEAGQLVEVTYARYSRVIISISKI
ncbi:hypothetical protein [Chitinophaga sp. 212800010-3]|uniref:hypothetical protein n=1 Tax=unclassified Chitinophaga TaxID=2619133 RepID=UPI002DE79423|nr:PH domain-containing protein [Chitinophaga sp. 212800010-3]